MLGKLLKHEFRATGRSMLPVYGALVILSVLGNLSIRFVNVTDSTFLTVLFTVVIVLFVCGIIAACALTVVMLVLRFHRNLLKEQGYLMHTLPVSVHAQVWSKLIAALVWIVATFLVVWLVIMLTVLIQSGTDLGELLDGLPTWAEFRRMLLEEGLSPGDLTVIGLECVLAGILGILVTILHFYAAMTLGHIGAKNKVLLSIVIFIGISFVFNILNTSFGVVQVRFIEGNELMLDTPAQLLGFMRETLGKGILVQLVQGGLLYLATVLGLKRGLNLA